MARSDLVKQMLTSYQRGDDAAFRQAAREVIDDERRKRHDVLADELERIVSGTRRPAARPLHISTVRPLPKTRADVALLDLAQPEARFTDLVLKASTRTVVEEAVHEFRSREVLAAHGLRPRSKLLFVGDPGTGKSRTAEAVASAIGVPIARLQLAAVVSSFLGETAQHLKQVLDFCEAGTWVLLIDEIDMLAKERGDQTEHGELRRVVAAFLQLLDDFTGDTLVIATSNHPSLLDPAVWRRFDDVVTFDVPTIAEIRELLRVFLRRFRTSFDKNDAARRLRGHSQADVEIAATTAARRAVLDGRTTITAEDIDHAIHRLSERDREVGKSLT